MMKQSELIHKMSDQDLKKSLILSQSLLFLLSMISSLFLFENVSNWFDYFNVNFQEIIYYGVIPGLIIVIIDIILIRFVPYRFFDDGGINQKMFQNRSISDIFILTLMIAVSEELLFRGVIQTTFGYLIASVIFALVHFRYLTKPILLLSVLLISFYIGYLFEITGNLLVVITAHFIVDFLLALIIRFRKWGDTH